MKLLPVAQRWGGGPLPKAVVKGFGADPSTIESSFDGPPPQPTAREE
jgi:hypothetical protein